MRRPPPGRGAEHAPASPPPATITAPAWLPGLWARRTDDVPGGDAAAARPPSTSAFEGLACESSEPLLLLRARVAEHSAVMAECANWRPAVAPPPTRAPRAGRRADGKESSIRCYTDPKPRTRPSRSPRRPARRARARASRVRRTATTVTGAAKKKRAPRVVGQKRRRSANRARKEGRARAPPARRAASSHHLVVVVVVVVVV